MSVPSTSKAVIQPAADSPTLQQTELAVPKPGPDEVQVRVIATAPCLGERGWEVAFPALFETRTERVPGTEGAGIVVSPGGEFKPGDEVFFRIDAWLNGAAREYTTVPIANLARKPKNLSWHEAAGTPLSALTAWQAVHEQGNVQPGDKVLIAGASGSVGLWAVRFAVDAGAQVIGTSSPKNADTVRAAGAHEVIDYKSTEITKWAEKEGPAATHGPADVVLDFAGKDLGSYWYALKDGGRFLSVCSDPTQSQPVNRKAEKAAWFLVQPRGSDLAQISDIIAAKGYKPTIDSVVAFEEFQAAWDKVDGGKAHGKVIIRVSEP